MRSFWSDPYLWIHLAGIAALPIFLEVCLVGLAIGDPILPTGLEWLLVATAGIAPILWMQWQRPFCIFCLLLVALKPNALTDDQRKLLRFFKNEKNRIVAIATAVFLAWVLWQLYYFAPLATSIAPTVPGGRFTGLLVGAIAFLLSNLFLQVPVSVVRVLLTGEAEFAAATPYPMERVTKDFTLLGWRVKRILPPMVMERVAPTPSVAVAGDSPVEPPGSGLQESIAAFVDESDAEDWIDTDDTPEESEVAPSPESPIAAPAVLEIMEEQSPLSTPHEIEVEPPPIENSVIAPTVSPESVPLTAPNLDPNSVEEFPATDKDSEESDVAAFNPQSEDPEFEVIQTEGFQIEDPQSEAMQFDDEADPLEGQAEEGQLENQQPEEIQSEAIPSGDGQIEEGQAEEIPSEEPRFEEIQTDEIQAEDNSSPATLDLVEEDRITTFETPEMPSASIDAEPSGDETDPSS